MAFQFTEEQLNTLDKSFIVELFLQLQEQNDKLSGEIQDLNRKMELLIEQALFSIRTDSADLLRRWMMPVKSVLWK